MDQIASGSQACGEEDGLAYRVVVSTWDTGDEGRVGKMRVEGPDEGGEYYGRGTHVSLAASRPVEHGEYDEPKSAWTALDMISLWSISMAY